MIVNSQVLHGNLINQVILMSLTWKFIYNLNGICYAFMRKSQEINRFSNYREWLLQPKQLLLK